MRKIAELNGDEFFDVIYALSPVLPMIADMEVVQAQLFHNYSDVITKARFIAATNTTLLKNAENPAKSDEYKKNIEDANQIINDEITGIFARDISKFVPLLSSRENRGCVFETLSIIDGVPVEQVKQYPAPKLITEIKKIVTDTDFKSFLSYAEELEQTQ